MPELSDLFEIDAMPLRQLAIEIVRLSQAGRSTPVVVTPRFLSLRHRFFVELADAIVEQADRAIRIDWCRPVPGYFTLLGDQIARLSAARHNHAMANRVSVPGANASVQITASIARPVANTNEIVVGICDERLQLPKWTTSIRLG